MAFDHLHARVQMRYNLGGEDQATLEKNKNPVAAVLKTFRALADKVSNLMANQDVTGMSKLTKAAIPGLEASLETVLNMYWVYHLPQHYRLVYASISKA